MAQLKLYKVPKPLRVAPAAILAASLLIGLALGGVVVDTLLRERFRQIVELEFGERPERSTTVVGIKEDGREVILSKLTVQLMENGRGRVLLRIAPMYFEVDTQRSAENAWNAVNLRYRLDNLDAVFIFEIEERLTIRGPSAGAAMAATLYALARSVYENKSWVVDNNIVASGTITADGRIMPMGEVELKAEKVRQGGFTHFVVSWWQPSFVPPDGLQVIRVRNLDELVREMVRENVG